MGWISKSGPLSQSEMENNADIIISTMLSKGYDERTIAGLLGNFQHESSINPARYEEGGGGGYGIIQWTPQSVLIQHASNIGRSDWQNGDTQVEVIISEILGTSGNNEWYSSSGFIEPYYQSGATSDMIGLTGTQFLSNSMSWSPEKLAVAFMVCRERPSYDPSVNHVDRRKASASDWYDYIQNGSFCQFEPRLNDSGMRNNPYWYSENPFYQSGYGLPNCTAYAWGRAYELTKERPTLSIGNANEWFGYRSDGYERGFKAKLGAIICYDGGTFGTGHVGVVEQINDDGSIIISNSNYGAEYFITYHLGSDYSMAGVTFQGFIYLPVCSYVPPVTRRKTNIYKYLKKRWI